MTSSPLTSSSARRRTWRRLCDAITSSRDSCCSCCIRAPAVVVQSVNKSQYMLFILSWLPSNDLRFDVPRTQNKRHFQPIYWLSIGNSKPKSRNKGNEKQNGTVDYRLNPHSLIRLLSYDTQRPTWTVGSDFISSRTLQTLCINIEETRLAIISKWFDKMCRHC